MVQRLLSVVLVGLLLAWSLPVPGSAQAYVLGAGDVIEVSVFNNPDVSRTVTVRPDGMISLPLVGEVKAAGLTPGELSAQLTQLFARYIRNPQVTVIVVTFRQITVVVLGQVGRPGMVTLKPGATLLDALAAAGGITENAGLGEVKLVRGQAAPIVVNVEKLLVQGDFSNNPALEQGDTILVPEDLTARFMVLGEVTRPGVYPMRGPVTALMAVSLAGGPTRRAHMGRAWLIRRGGAGLPPASLPPDTKEVNPGVYVIPLDLQRVIRDGDVKRDVALQRGDILYVPENLFTFDNLLLVLGVISRVLNLVPGP